MRVLPMRLLSAIALTFGAATSSVAQEPVAHTLVLHPGEPGPVISRDIFGQFAEHLGEGVYGGIWVGPDSSIPNVRGIRSDVVAALRALHVPNVRWPGGCFAEEYHWRNGIGPAKARPRTLNRNWGGVIETNRFGTHEFMDFVSQIGSEAYLTVNVASGTVQEAADWLEYLTTDQDSTLGRERAANGRKAPWRIKYLGFGNESWGCGGAMRAEAYVDRMKRFSNQVRNDNPAQASDPWRPSPEAMQRIAVGPDAGNTEYTEAVMAAWKQRLPLYWGIEGIALHSYTWGGNPKNAAATGFGEKEYAGLLRETLRMDDLIARHSAIMDKYDPRKRVMLAVDEWGVWLRPQTGTNPNFLRQDQSLRDAIAAALNLNIFARHADRVRLANIAQMVNVLQAMIMTRGAKMLLTPTYHVYRMYVPFQDAELLPLTFDAGQYAFGTVTLPGVDAIAARARDGKTWLSLTNLDPNEAAEIVVRSEGAAAASAVGETLTAPRFDTVNSFSQPDAVAPRPYRAAARGGTLVLSLPPASVTVVQLVP